MDKKMEMVFSAIVWSLPGFIIAHFMYEPLADFILPNGSQVVSIRPFENIWYFRFVIKTGLLFAVPFLASYQFKNMYSAKIIFMLTWMAGLLGSFFCILFMKYNISSLENSFGTSSAPYAYSGTSIRLWHIPVCGILGMFAMLVLLRVFRFSRR